jgi:hypothetical protein
MNPTAPAVLLPAPGSEVKPALALRLRGADRQQREPPPRVVEDWIEAEHPAPVVWALVAAWEVAVRYERVRAVDGQAGRRATAGRILMALWL